MARGWPFTKLSLSSALLLYFSGISVLLFFLSFCSVFMLSLELCRCFFRIFLSVDHVPDWQPRILLGMVEA